jgi:hypothetical protein
MTAPPSGVIEHTFIVPGETCVCIAQVRGLFSDDVARFSRTIESAPLLYETVEALAGVLDLICDAQDVPQPSSSRFAWQLLHSIRYGVSR